MRFNQFAWGYIGYVFSHSWVERLMVINTNGTMTGRPGYIRGAISRLNVSFFEDSHMQHLLPDGSGGQSSDRICRNSQTTRNYTAELPPLEARSGDFIAIQYQENGHVSLPELSPQKSGSGEIYIYGTSFPQQFDSLDSIHKIWTLDGAGGDRRGRLLVIRSFDDTQCYQINRGRISRQRQEKIRKIAMDPQGADLWCQSDIQIPFDLPVSSWYTIYWVWDWPSAPSSLVPKGAAELYTSCMDVKIVAGTRPNGLTFDDEQDINFAGIKEQLQSYDHKVAS